MKSRMTENELLERIAGLPKEVAPPRDPWPEISARIERAGVSGRTGFGRRRWSMAAAAAVLLAITAGLVFGPMRSQAPGLPTGGIELAERNAAPGMDHISAMIAGSEAEYLAAFREFIPVGDSRSHLPEQAVEMIETSWTELTKAEAELTAALERNPNDPFLNKRMLELRARQLSFLKQLAVLDFNNRRLTI
jgi:hypothetical protein